jgi:hypothetical protein
LYFTELYKDQDAATPIDAGARVFRVRFAAAGNGDYNADGSVDAADHVVWRNTLGSNVTPFTGADGDGDGSIDQDDYIVWKANFGKMLGLGSGAAIASTGSAMPPPQNTAPESAATAGPLSQGFGSNYDETIANTDRPVVSATMADHDQQAPGLLLSAFAEFVPTMPFSQIRIAGSELRQDRTTLTARSDVWSRFDEDQLLLLAKGSPTDDDVEFESATVHAEGSRKSDVAALDDAYGDLEPVSSGFYGRTKVRPAI